MIISKKKKKKRVLDATCDQVWEAWTQPELMVQWFSPLGMTTSNAESDLRVGGKYRVVMEQGEKPLPTPPPFGKTLIAEGVYEQIERPHLLVFTWSWVGWEEISRVRIELKDRGGQTELQLTHTRLSSEESKQFHDMGWQFTLDSLIEYVTRPRPSEALL